MAHSRYELGGEHLSGRAINPALIRRLLAFARPHLGGFAGSVALLVLLAGLTLSVPLILAEAIDRYVAAGSSALGEAARHQGVLLTGAILLGIGSAAYGCRFFQLLVINTTGQKVIHDLRMAVYAHITNRNLRYFDRHPVGTLVTRVTSDIETLNEFFISGLDVFLYDLLRISIITGLLFALDWQMALATLGVVPLIAAWAFYFQRQARRLFREVRGRVSSLNAFLNESLAGVRVIQLFRREPAASRRFHRVNRELRDAHVGTVRNFSWFFCGMELIPAMGTALILVVGYHLVLGSRLQIGDLLAFWFYLKLFIEPLRQLADKYNILQAAVASGERVFAVLDDTSALPVAAEPAHLQPDGATIRFEDVHFAYTADKPVLRGVSWSAAPGERIAFVGATGSGKTTIINLLLRFYDPTAGASPSTTSTCAPDPLRAAARLRPRPAGGLPLRRQRAGEPRPRRRGPPRRHPHGSGHRGPGRPHHPAPRRPGRPVPGARRHPHAGEQQLLAIARTLADDPRILVLDEATANVDTATEAQIEHALDRLTTGRTSVVIAHRLSTVRRADRILVMHHGEMRESGTHHELLDADGIYARLHQLQFIQPNPLEAELPPPKR